MRFPAIILVLLVALLHGYFLVLEMFLWTTPYGLQTFNNSPEFAEASKVLAMNQGLYNGFLAAGLLWGLFLGANGKAVLTFFLMCIIIAGIFGAATVSMKIFYIQAIPAAIALVFVWLAAKRQVQV